MIIGTHPYPTLHHYSADSLSATQGPVSGSGLLFPDGEGVDPFALLVDETHLRGVRVERDHPEPQGCRREPGERRPAHRAGLGAAAEAEVLDGGAVRMGMLQVVVVAGEAGVDVVLLEQGDQRLLDFRGAAVGGRGGVGGVVEDHELPAGLGGAQLILAPPHLDGRVLAFDVVGVGRFILVLLDEGGGIQHQEQRGGSIRQGAGEGEIAPGLPPPHAGLGIFKLGVDAAFMVVVAQGDVPGHHQRRIPVDLLEIDRPQGIPGAGDAFAMEVVPAGDQEGGVDLPGRSAELPGDLELAGGLLVGVVDPGPAPVAEDQEGQGLLPEDQGTLGLLGLQAGKD